MNKKLFVILMLVAVVLSSCTATLGKSPTIKGSGKVISETRQASGFTSVVLEGSGDVTVKHGDTESLAISAEDNILPLIETKVEGHRLVIGTKTGVSYSATKPVKIDVTVTSLEEVSLPGSGNMDVQDISSDTFSAQLPGSGNITLAGIAQTTHYVLNGSGNIVGDQLKAKQATAEINGSGTITLYASDSLKGSISGSGDIRYSGSPAQVDKNVRGSGSIHE